MKRGEPQIVRPRPGHIIRKLCPTLLLAALMVVSLAPAGATLQNLQAGMKAPSFSLRELSGKGGKVSSSFSEHKLTVIVFWSTVTAKSEANLVRMDKLYRRYREKGLAVVAVNAEGEHVSETGIAQVGKTVEKLKLAVPVLIDSGLSTFRQYGVIALPSTVVVDREGVIRFELSGYPLVGSEQLAASIVAALEEKQEPAVAARHAEGYRPNAKAQRLFNMGTSALKSGQAADAAVGWFRQAIEADPHFPLPWISLGSLHVGKGDNARAKEEFAQALAVEPENVTALCETALLAGRDGKIAEGKALVERAMKIDPAYPPCHYYMAYLVGKSGALIDSMRMFDEAAKLDPGNVDGYLLKGELLEEKQRKAEAAAAYGTALQLLLELQ